MKLLIGCTNRTDWHTYWHNHTRLRFAIPIWLPWLNLISCLYPGLPFPSIKILLWIRDKPKGSGLWWLYNLDSTCYLLHLSYWILFLTFNNFSFWQRRLTTFVIGLHHQCIRLQHLNFHYDATTFEGNKVGLNQWKSRIVDSCPMRGHDCGNRIILSCDNLQLATHVFIINYNATTNKERV